MTTPHAPRPSLKRTRLAGLAALALLAACGGSDVTGSGTSGDALHDCHGVASRGIPASGDYYLTTFGGPSEPQPLACGGSSRSGAWFYAAAEQRYGCGAHLQLEAHGRCVVVQTADYGPDVCVETAAGRAIIDASPLVGTALFGQADLGWSDRAAIHVTLVDPSVPLGPCAPTETSPDAGSPADTGAAPDAGSLMDTGSDPDTGTPPAPDAGAPADSERACASDGDCNPGSDGAGMICVRSTCVPGCNADWECPGSTACVDGSCR